MPQSTATKRNVSRQPRRRSRADLKLAIETALRLKFQHDTVDISDGFEGNVHIIVVSRTFERMSEKTRQAYLWKLVEQAHLTESEKDLITLVYAISPRELV